MDYRRFLGRSEELVLAYLGGAHVDAGSRRLRVTGAIAPGFHRFRVEGRRATPIEPAPVPELEHLPSRVGHFVAGALALPDGTFERLELLPEDEPDVLTKVRGRVWHDGALLFSETLFEDEAEPTARARLDDGAPLDGVSGVGASLRAAFAAALAIRVGRRLGVELSPLEVRGSVRAIAERGQDAALELVRRVEERRAAAHEEIAARRREEQAVEIAARSLAERGGERGQRAEDAEDRAERALASVGGRLLSSRRLGGGQLEVRYELYGERFATIVDAVSLHVLDAGICLAGADEELTLESLPSAIREAIEGDELVITRRWT